MGYAQHRFWLSETLPESEITRAEHLEGIYQQTGTAPEELNGPQLPYIASHVWEWFLGLSSSRQGGAISFQEIEAWSRLTGTQLEEWEIQAIKQIDIHYLNHRQNGRHRQTRNKG